MCASLQTQSGTHQLLNTLLSHLTPPTKLRQFPVYSNACLDSDNLSELCQSMTSLAECYAMSEPLSDYSSD